MYEAERQQYFRDARVMRMSSRKKKEEKREGMRKKGGDGGGRKGKSEMWT